MHQFSEAKSIVECVLQNAPANSKKITAINIVTHEMSEAEKESLYFHFHEASRDTIAFGAKINLKVSPVHANDSIESIEIEE